MANDLTKFEQQGQAPAPSYSDMPLMNMEVFNHMYRVGAMMAKSPLFPEHLRKGSREEAEANGMLVMNMAVRLREDPLTVAQNIYFVGGKPGWNATYMISKANQHGVFADPIDWDVTGKGETLSVTAYATMKGTGKRVEANASFDMAKKEGWTRNSKYQSMPEQMLRYRSATMLIRLYCPEVMVGIPAAIEVETGNMRDVTPQDTGNGADLAAALPEAAPEDKRGKVDRTPPAPAQSQTPEPEGEDKPDPAAARVYGKNDGQHARRTKDQIALDRELEDLAETLGIDVPTDRPAAVALDELRARAEESGGEDSQAEPDQGEGTKEPDPAPARITLDTVKRQMDAVQTEEELNSVAEKAGYLMGDEREDARSHYITRRAKLREAAQGETQQTHYNPEPQQDSRDYVEPDESHVPTMAEIIIRELDHVVGGDVEAVMDFYDQKLGEMAESNRDDYERVMGHAEKRAAMG